MLLIIDVERDSVHCQNLIRFVDDDEAAFGALNELVKRGFRLQKASLVEAGSRFTIPGQAFNGQPVGENLKALQAQWQQGLKPLAGVRSKTVLPFICGSVPIIMRY